MQNHDQLQYTTVPECQSWIIPFWDQRDRDEFDDLTTTLQHRGAERFCNAIEQLKKGIRQSDDVVGVRFYVGMSLPDRVTLTLVPDTQEQAIEILTEASAMMGERGVVPWSQISSCLSAIQDAVSKADERVYPSFGFSIIIPSHQNYAEASTDWIARE